MTVLSPWLLIACFCNNNLIYWLIEKFFFQKSVLCDGVDNKDHGTMRIFVFRIFIPYDEYYFVQGHNLNLKI